MKRKKCYNLREKINFEKRVLRSLSGGDECKLITIIDKIGFRIAEDFCNLYCSKNQICRFYNRYGENYKQNYDEPLFIGSKL
ncbi:MAG: hypothetical protein NC935_02180 [Candidatus Omnitrophica bacterium]|nr:hypothetical protein [Candidatus Omnitrophota bacterium]